MSNIFPVYLEIGAQRAFAGAVDWPGWCRGGRDEAAAMQALFACAPRYAHLLHAAGITFAPPAAISDLVVVERVPGNATTDFGAPDATLAGDGLPVEAAELERLQALMAACWRAFSTAVKDAAGKDLAKGPRGGGRDVDAIVRHVIGANAGYLARLAWKLPKQAGASLDEEIAANQEAIASALEAAAHGLTPARGPRGGVIWAPRTFVRRAAWHLLDHAWEIEDRVAR